MGSGMSSTKRERSEDSSQQQHSSSSPVAAHSPTAAKQDTKEEAGLPRKVSRSEMDQQQKQQQQQQPPADSPVASVEADQAFLDRYSRQIGTYGMDTMSKLVSLKVLIIGCGGVGAETAKNLALAGVHTITLMDSRVARPADLGVNFALQDTHIGNMAVTIADATATLIRDLNPTVRCRVAVSLTEEEVAKHSVVVFTSAAPDLSLKTLVHWDNFCRSQKPAVSFILALQGGALASVFVDHGPLFTVKDRDGRTGLQKQILEVTTKTDKKGQEYTRVRFATPEGQTPGALRDYTRVKFSDVKGLTLKTGDSINDVCFDALCAPLDAKNCIRIYPSLHSLGYSPYITGGFIHEQKETVELSFRSLAEAIVAPGNFTTVSPFMDNVLESQVHTTVVGLLRFAEAHQGQLPPLHNGIAAEETLQLAKAYLNENARANETSAPDAAREEVPEDPDNERPARYPPPPPPKPLVVDSLDEDFIRRASLLAVAELQPLGAFFGAVVAQEIVKITGKYMPVHQWFNFHCFEALPTDLDYTTSAEVQPRGSRYDNNIVMFGCAFQEKLLNLKLFMVGCGALGCENIKNFALAGICCGPAGNLVVTDNDRIEISNLSRQFLFREDNVGQPKSTAACNRMLKMNSAAKVDPRQDFVGPNTQHLYPDRFWMGLDAVVNALDNIEARLYVDKQCVLFHKVLVEAGTMGTAGNIDIIVPGKTTSYSDGGAADETGGIPMCTLRNFPYIYDHCIEWARAQFDDLFVFPVQQSLQLVEDPTGYSTKLRHEIDKAETSGLRRTLLEKHVKALKGIVGTLSVLKIQPTMHDCMVMAWNCMHELFRDKILDLQTAFPADTKKSNGEPFWSGHRTFPTPIDGTAESMAKHSDVYDFLISGANLYASMFGLHAPKHAPKYNDPKHRWMDQYRHREWVLSELKDTAIPLFKHSAVDGLDDESAGAMKNAEAQAENEQLQNDFDRLLQEVEALAHACKGSKAEPLDFEKDDDDNFHIDFVTAAANLRALNYSIKPHDRMKVKMVAGKIIPAIATTTAAVTGLALIEFYKVLQNKDVSNLRNGMIDVGTNNYVLFERDPPIKKRTTVEKTYLPEKDYTYRKKVIRVPNGFTKYDQFVVDVTRTTTVAEFGDDLLKQLNATLPPDASNQFDVLAIGVGTGMLWNGSKKHSNTNKPIMTVIEEQRRKEGFPETMNFWDSRVLFSDLSVNISIDDDEADEDEIEVDTATVVLRIG